MVWETSSENILFAKCQVFVIAVGFCRSTPAFCQGIVLCLGVEVGKKEINLDELASGPLSRLTWFEWETWTLVSLYQLSPLPAKLLGDFLCNGGKSRAFSRPPFKTLSGLQNPWDSQGQCKTNLVFKMKCFLACRDHSNSYLCISLIPYHHCPPLPKTDCLRTSDWSIYTFSNIKVNIVPLKEGYRSSSALSWWLVILLFINVLYSSKAALQCKSHRRWSINWPLTVKSSALSWTPFTE